MDWEPASAPLPLRDPHALGTPSPGGGWGGDHNGESSNRLVSVMGADGRQAIY